MPSSRNVAMRHNRAIVGRNRFPFRWTWTKHRERIEWCQFSRRLRATHVVKINISCARLWAKLKGLAFQFRKFFVCEFQYSSTELYVLLFLMMWNGKVTKLKILRSETSRRRRVNSPGRQRLPTLIAVQRWPWLYVITTKNNKKSLQISTLSLCKRKYNFDTVNT